jgi:hypothetical protein
MASDLYRLSLPYADPKRMEIAIPSLLGWGVENDRQSDTSSGTSNNLQKA